MRNIALICPQLDIDKLLLRQEEILIDYWDYLLLPIIILTSSDGVFDQVRAKVFGATDFINKPIKKDRIFAILNKHLQTSSRNECSQNFVLSY